MKNVLNDTKKIDVRIDRTKFKLLYPSKELKVRQYSLYAIFDEGTRIVIGIGIGPSESFEGFLTAFQSILKQKGRQMPESLIGNYQVISDISRLEWEGEILGNKIKMIDNIP
jgi:hypothetical protein